MVSAHETAQELLVAYADSELPAARRAAVEGHLQGCSECAMEVAELRRLNQTLASFPPAPPVPFKPFWAKLQAGLPAASTRRTPFFVPGRRLALAFALAALLALMLGISALASEAVMPDNPLYSVKRFREQVQLTLSLDPHARLQLEIQLAAERLREAQMMSANHRPELAVSSLNDFDALVKAARPRLERSGALSDREGTEDIIESLRVQLTGVQEINETRGGDDREVRASVEKARKVLSRDESKDVREFERKVENNGNRPTSAPAPQQSERPVPKGSDKPESDSGRD